jgi:hypothetical protein
MAFNFPLRSCEPPFARVLSSNLTGALQNIPNMWEPRPVRGGVVCAPTLTRRIGRVVGHHLRGELLVLNRDDGLPVPALPRRLEPGVDIWAELGGSLSGIGRGRADGGPLPQVGLGGEHVGQVGLDGLGVDDTRVVVKRTLSADERQEFPRVATRARAEPPKGEGQTASRTVFLAI